MCNTIYCQGISSPVIKVINQLFNLLIYLLRYFYSCGIRLVDTPGPSHYPYSFHSFKTDYTRQQHYKKVPIQNNIGTRLAMRAIVGQNFRSLRREDCDRYCDSVHSNGNKHNIKHRIAELTSMY